MKSYWGFVSDGREEGMNVEADKFHHRGRQYGKHSTIISRGRCFEHLNIETLKQRWISAFKALV